MTSSTKPEVHTQHIALSSKKERAMPQVRWCMDMAILDMWAGRQTDKQPIRHTDVLIKILRVYDTIRYDKVYILCAQMLTRWPAWSSARHKNEKVKKTKNKKTSSSKKTVQVIMKAVREEEYGKGVGFVKQVSFKPGVKERGSYGWAEWTSIKGYTVSMCGCNVREMVNGFAACTAYTMRHGCRRPSARCRMRSTENYASNCPPTCHRQQPITREGVITNCWASYPATKPPLLRISTLSAPYFSKNLVLMEAVQAQKTFVLCLIFRLCVTMFIYTQPVN